MPLTEAASERTWRQIVRKRAGVLRSLGQKATLAERARGRRDLILITGGLGYVGSHAVRYLLEQGREVLLFDNLVYGHEAASSGAPYVIGDLNNPQDIRAVFRQHDIDSVMHFAAFAAVGESVEEPKKYFDNNVRAGLNLLDAMLEADVKRLVFSSTCAIFGEPVEIPMTEDHPRNPTNPYGESKLFFEKALKWYDGAYGLKAMCLRYFNAAGAHPSGEIGEDHDPERHLIPLVIGAATGLRPALTVFGDDYPTPDGTCIRDYIHVSDLAQAHLLALEKLEQGGPSGAYNLGNGHGYSVLEVIKTVENVTGLEAPYSFGERRAGDPARLVGSSQKAFDELGWKPQFADLRTIVATAWKWHKAHPHGYGNG
ncbi:MAG: UDP-glucose 4-epimerase GalE [Armatimonadetes bacterium]|nr:UDP-glucose 4-epimerase GalE [Armatimonadota bacterium]